MSSHTPDRDRTRASRFLGELKRRQVIKVGVVYVVVGLGVAEAADVFLGNLAPQWALDAALVILLVGFPVSLVLAWVYDLTPRGVVREGGTESRDGLAAPVEAPTREGLGSHVPPSRDRRSIAVLPFRNHSSDPENEFFADGITDDILTALTLVEGLSVTSRTSTMRYRGSDKGTRAIAEELGVGTVLEGSVRRSNGRVRIVAQLVDASTDGHLWADTYDRELKDAFAVQTDVAENVASALRSRLSPRGRARLAAMPPRNVQAYELVARARHAYLQVTQDHVDHGMKLLRQAVDLDPGYAQAWAHLAIAHFVLPYHSTVSPSSIEASAREAIDRALELDDSLPEAYVARAFWRFNFRFDWAGAERDFATALELNPSSADAYQWRSLVHLVSGHPVEAVADARQGVSLDPLSFQTRSQLAQNLTWAGQPIEAKAILEEIIREDPTNFVAHWALGVVVRPDDPAAALAHFEDAVSQADVPLAHASRSLTLRMLGRGAEADQIIDELETRTSGTEYVSPFALVVAYCGKGDFDRGLDHLEAGVAKHDFMTLHVRLIASGFGFEDHPRYRALVRDIWPDERSFAH
jgi:adenylate cyclase